MDISLRTNKMLAAVLYGKEQVKVEPVAVPEIGSGDILVRVKAALTCGTDVKVFRRGYHARMIVPPALFGHELAGDIVAVGRDVVRWRTGQRIMAANSAPCGRCFYCQKNVENLCEDLLFNNGAYAEYIRIPERIAERNTYELPGHVSYQDAALAEPLACVLRGVDESNIRAGDNVVIIGLGPIGLMFVRVAALKGARVIAIGRRPMQLDRAASLGAQVLLTADDDLNIVTAVRDVTKDHGADIAIEAVGSPQTWQQAVQMVRRGGTVNFFGGCPSDTTVPIDTQHLHYSEITLKASFHHTPAHIRAALDMITQGHITARQFVNSEAPLSKLLDVFKHLMSHNGHLKTAIIP
ncbi:MAG: zinc-binding dehydrogenase [Bryobacteraceae bacterium]|nr:zinc-binding dehydrogenase [Bryobacteraceae bacterium]